MKILVITSRIPFPVNDGGNIATMQMLQSLLHCNFDVTLLSLNTSKHYIEPGELPPIFSTLKTASVKVNTDVNIKDAVINLFGNNSYNAQRFYSDDFKDLLIRNLTNNHYDIVLFEGIYVAMYADTVKQYSQAKSVLRSHNIEHHIWNRAAAEESFLKRKYIMLLAQRLKSYEIAHWEKFDAIVPISAIDELFIKEHNKITKHYLSLPTAFDMSATPTDNIQAEINHLFHLGSMDWMPNQQAMEWFIENVWPRIEKETKAEFFMAGKNMPESFFEHKSDRFHVQGEVEQVAEFMQNKQIMVVPLFAGSGVRIKILEGMAAAKTIITTSLGVQGIDAYDKEHVLIANNPDSFANAIIWCLKNERKAKEIGKNARNLMVEKYSLTNFETRINNFFNSILTATK